MKKNINSEKKGYYKKNIIGRRNTKEEIITELKTKGKYDEWVSLGSYFGLTSTTLKAKFFLKRPYKYYNVDGNIINVSMITKNFRPDVDNIAVFKQLFIKDPTHVDQSKYRIVNSNKTLSTAGLATCTGLAMIIGTKKFMTHLDANTAIKIIISAINEEIEKQNIEPNTLKPIIYAGRLDSSITLKKAKDICLLVGIPDTNYTISNVCMMDRVYI